MASVENGSTQGSILVTPNITPVNNGVPSDVRTETSITFSSPESAFDSGDQGTTQVSAVVSKLTPTGVFSPNGQITQLSGGMGSLLLSQFDNDDYGFTSSGGAPLAVPSNPIVLVNYYKMRGFYAIGSVYETWIVTDVPSVTPPSGHTLNNVSIEAYWQS